MLLYGNDVHSYRHMTTNMPQRHMLGTEKVFFATVASHRVLTSFRLLLWDISDNVFRFVSTDVQTSPKLFVC